MNDYNETNYHNNSWGVFEYWFNFIEGEWLYRHEFTLKVY